jgi:hypothetical protein
MTANTLMTFGAYWLTLCIGFLLGAFWAAFPRGDDDE